MGSIDIAVVDILCLFITSNTAAFVVSDPDFFVTNDTDPFVASDTNPFVTSNTNSFVTSGTNPRNQTRIIFANSNHCVVDLEISPIGYNDTDRRDRSSA